MGLPADAAAMLKWFDESAKFFILLALSAIGLGTNVASLRAIGVKPFVVGLCVAAVLATFSLTVILLTGL